MQKNIDSEGKLLLISWDKLKKKNPIKLLALGRKH